MPEVPLNEVSFEFFARFVLAGFIVFVVRNAYVVGERPKIAEVALDIVLMSLVNQLVWQLGTSLAAALYEVALVVSTMPEALPRLVPGPVVQFNLEVIVLPAVLGVVLGRLLRSAWNERLARSLALPVVDPIPRAFDHVFLTRGPGFVIITFKDGTQLPGYYGKASRVGRDPGRSEIYLQRLYEIRSGGDWHELSPRRSILVNLSDMRSIEFLEPENADVTQGSLRPVQPPARRV